MVATQNGEASLLDELKAAAEQLGYEVRQERLLREVGYRVRSGSCRVRDTNIILLDRTLPEETQVEIMLEELRGKPLEAIYLSPRARQLLDGRSG